MRGVCWGWSFPFTVILNILFPLISPHGAITPHVSEVSGACLHFQQVPLRGRGSVHLPPWHSRAAPCPL